MSSVQCWNWEQQKTGSGNRAYWSNHICVIKPVWEPGYRWYRYICEQKSEIWNVSLSRFLFFFVWNGLIWLGQAHLLSVRDLSTAVLVPFFVNSSWVLECALVSNAPSYTKNITLINSAVEGDRGTAVTKQAGQMENIINFWVDGDSFFYFSAYFLPSYFQTNVAIEMCVGSNMYVLVVGPKCVYMSSCCDWMELRLSGCMCAFMTKYRGRLWKLKIGACKDERVKFKVIRKYNENYSTGPFKKWACSESFNNKLSIFLVVFSLPLRQLNYSVWKFW